MILIFEWKSIFRCRDKFHYLFKPLWALIVSALLYYVGFMLALEETFKNRQVCGIMTFKFIKSTAGYGRTRRSNFARG